MKWLLIVLFATVATAGRRAKRELLRPDDKPLTKYNAEYLFWKNALTAFEKSGLFDGAFVKTFEAAYDEGDWGASHRGKRINFNDIDGLGVRSKGDGYIQGEALQPRTD